jgi:hypothetical protein
METSKCQCGSPATTEMQVGWDPKANGGVGGGQYLPLCEKCYDDSDEAERHRREHARRVAGLPSPGYST